MRSLLSGFYDREELLSKTFKELDKDVIEACVGKFSNIHFSALLCFWLVKDCAVLENWF